MRLLGYTITRTHTVEATERQRKRRQAIRTDVAANLLADLRMATEKPERCVWCGRASMPPTGRGVAI